MKQDWQYDGIKADTSIAFQQWRCYGCSKQCTRLMGLNDDAPEEACDEEGKTDR